MMFLSLFFFFSHYVCDGSPGTCSWLPVRWCPHWLLCWPQKRSQHRTEWPSLCWQLVNMHGNPYFCLLMYICTPASHVSLPFRWSGFLLCAIAMLLVIFPMFAFPKKLPPRHKKWKKKKMGSPDVSSDDDMMKEKSSSKGQNVSSSMGFGKDIKGEEVIIWAVFHLWSPKCYKYFIKRSCELLMDKWSISQSIAETSHFIQ